MNKITLGHMPVLGQQVYSVYPKLRTSCWLNHCWVVRAVRVHVQYMYMFYIHAYTQELYLALVRYLNLQHCDFTFMLYGCWRLSKLCTTFSKHVVTMATETIKITIKKSQKLYVHVTYHYMHYGLEESWNISECYKCDIIYQFIKLKAWLPTHYIVNNE